MPSPLEGRTLALAEGRQLEEMAEMFEKEGAKVLRCPLLAILDAPDPAPVSAWLRRLAADGFGYVVFLTGEGVRRLLGAAQREGRRDAVLSALGRTRLVTRGPKPVRALKEVDLKPTLVAAAPTTEGVIEVMRPEPLRGEVVGVQLYAPENAPLTQFLASAGALVQTVLPYVYAPAADAVLVADLIHRLARGSIDGLVFTSSPQVDRLFDVAGEQGLTADLRVGLEKTCVAAVGPIVAENLRGRGARVDVCPEQGFVMKNLVQHIKRQFGGA
jgi:uroporphyrinogen-III synthase